MIAEPLAAPTTCCSGCPVHHPPTLVETGPLVVDLTEATATVNGKPLALTPTETRLLCYLAARAGRLCRYQDLIPATLGPWWSDGYSERHALSVRVSLLRRRLGVASVLIETRKTLGYCLALYPPSASLPLARTRVPDPALTKQQRRLIALLAETPGQRVSLRQVGLVLFGDERAIARWNARSMAEGLQRRGYPLKLDMAPWPEGGWLTLDEDSAP